MARNSLGIYLILALVGCSRSVGPGLEDLSRSDTLVDGQAMDSSGADGAPLDIRGDGAGRDLAVLDSNTPADLALPAETALPDKGPAADLKPAPCGMTPFENQVFDLLNQDRDRAGGLPPLLCSFAATAVAHTYAATMCSLDLLSHSADGTTLAQRLASGGITLPTQTEFLYAGDVTPPQVASAWIKVPARLQSLLNKSFTTIGAGHAPCPGSGFKHYWNVVLAGP